MKTGILIILSILVVHVNAVKGQNEYPLISHKVNLKTIDKPIYCWFNSNPVIISDHEYFICQTENGQKTVHINAIRSIQTINGDYVYPIDSVYRWIQSPEPTPQPVIEECDTLAYLRYEMLHDVYEGIDFIETEIRDKRQLYKQANPLLQRDFKSLVYGEMLKSSIRERMLNLTVNGQGRLTFKTDTNGIIRDILLPTHLARDTIFRELILPSLYTLKDGKSFLVDSVVYDYKEVYRTVYNEFKVKLDELNCDRSSLDKDFEVANFHLSKIDNQTLSVNTRFDVSIRYNFDKRFEQWVIKKNQVYLREGRTHTLVTDSMATKDFLELTKNQKTGKYWVSANYNSFLTNKEQIDVLNVRKRYINYSYLGFTYTTNLAQTNSGNILLAFNEIPILNANVIYHRLGVFYGQAVKNTWSKSGTEPGLHYRSLSNIQQLGVLVGLSQHMYLSVGISDQQSQVQEYENGVPDGSSLRSYNVRGPVAGVTMVFGFLMVEGRYNAKLNSFNVGLGLCLRKNL